MPRPGGRVLAPLLVLLFIAIFSWSSTSDHDQDLGSRSAPQDRGDLRIEVDGPPPRNSPASAPRPPPPSPPMRPHDKTPPTTETASQLPLSQVDTLAAIDTILHLKQDDELGHHVNNHNHGVMNRLVECAFAKSCKGHQSTVVILDSHFFALASSHHRWRDDYFERSAIEALETLGVSYLYSWRNSSFAVAIHNLFPSFVKAVIFQEGDHVYDLKQCFVDDAEESDIESQSGNGLITPGCVQSPRNPKGLPAWKIFAWSQDENEHSPLGRPWSLVSEPFENGATFMGFTMEHACNPDSPTHDIPFIPHAKRPSHPHSRAWIHANLETYFAPHHNVWAPAWFERAGKEIDVLPYAALEPEIARLRFYKAAEGKHFVPDNLVELDRSKMDREILLKETAKSVVFVGLLDPKEMVMPYEALCMGVPYINPIQWWDPSNPSDRTRWIVQNTLAKNMDPPYVYNVRRDDEEGFIDALKKARDNPIDRYIPEQLKTHSVRDRWRKWLDRDFQQLAMALNVLEPYTPVDGAEEVP